MLPAQKPTAVDQQILSLGQVLQSLREEDNVDALMDITISYLQEQFEYKLIWIALYDRLNHILFGKKGITPSKDTNFLQQRLVLSPGDLFEQVVIEQHPLGVADLRSEKRAEGWQELAQKFNLQGTIILPIRYKDRCLGVVLLSSQHWGYLLGGEAKARLMMVLGELGSALYQVEIDIQHKQTKRIDEPVLQLLENLHTLTNLEQRLEAVVKATHQFVLPSRTNIYWFEREGRFFWRRVTHQSNSISTHGERQVAITAQELSDFYYALSVNEIVLIGEGRSSLKSHFTGKLLQRLGVRSLLAAPIIWQKNLLGFLALEDNDPRIWIDGDKNFVKTAAGLISLVVPTENMETTITDIRADAKLTSQVTKAIYSNQDVEEIFTSCATSLLERFRATQFLILQYDAEQNNYQLFYQSNQPNRRHLTFTLDALKEVDRQLLQRSQKAVGIENLEDDLRFFNWRSSMLSNGVRSLLITNCAVSAPPEALLIVASEVTRAWTTLEKELLQVVGQQIGVTIRQWQLHTQTGQQQKILRTFKDSLYILKDLPSATNKQGQEHLERTALQQIASAINCPFVILLSWMPGDNNVEVIQDIADNNLFNIVADTPILYQTEPLIQLALTTDSLLSIKVDDLLPQTKEWLNCSSIGEILVMALRTTTVYEPTGVVIIADRSGRQWSKQCLIATETLISQLAWSRRYLQIAQLLSAKTQDLNQLNWYKHRRLEEIQRTTVFLLSKMQDLGVPHNELTHTRYQQLLRQLDNVTASVSKLLKLEQWELHISMDTIPIASLFKRAIERIDNLLKQQKLWVGVHGLGQPVQGEELEKNLNQTSKPLAYANSSLIVTGDVSKIELILHELLVTACLRSQAGNRIDIWCRRLDERSLEVSITDNGIIDPQILAQLREDIPVDLLAPSKLDRPPGLHFLICQKLMQQLAGELHFYQLPDGRVVSRLLLPLAGNKN